MFPFRALRPAPTLAAQLASVPYDVVSSAEARALAAGNRVSFLHVTKPEIGLPDATDPHSAAVYAAGAEALRRLQSERVLVRDAQPSFYVYALTWQGRTQTGVAHLASLDDYEHNVVRRHELTRPDKEDDRVRHLEALRAQTGIVFLLHKDHAGIDALVAQATRPPADIDFTAADGVRHQVWTVGVASTAALARAFDEVGPLYIADGHHRSAAAARIPREQRGDPPGFLAVSFPVSQVRILPYHRVVRDLGGLSPEAFLEAVRARFDVRPGAPAQVPPRTFGMCLRSARGTGSWSTLTARAAAGNLSDPVRALDVSVLQDELLAPVLGIGDPRRDPRIDFIGGIRGDAALEDRVREGWAVAFKMPPTTVAELLAVADGGQMMPPKSTWFEPKLRDGLFIHLLESPSRSRASA